MTARSTIRRIAIGCARVADFLHMAIMFAVALFVVVLTTGIVLLVVYGLASLVVDSVAARVAIVAAVSLFGGLATYGREIGGEVSR